MERVLYILFVLMPFIAFNQDTISVFFDHNSHVLNTVEKNKLLFFSENPNSQISLLKIESHCDVTGSIEYNDKLAKRRLEEVLSISPPLRHNESEIIRGERDAQSSQNKPQDYFRRVSIIYNSSTPPPKVLSSQVDLPVVKDIENEFSEFLKDPTASERTIQLSVLFFPGEDILLPGQESELSKLYDFLHYNQSITAHIRGHVCCGSNQDLSSARSFVVYSYLTKHSISPDRLTYKGYNNTIPFVFPEITESDKISNRRVDVVFTKK